MTPRVSDIVIGSPPSAPSTRLFHPKKESGSSNASSAQVKKEGSATPTSFARVKKEPCSFTRVKTEPCSFTRVKKEHDALAPPSSEKARRLVEYASRQLAYQAPDDPEEFPGQRAAERASFNEVQPRTLEFALAWSR
jgi:hypothetical protein